MSTESTGPLTAEDRQPYRQSVGGGQRLGTEAKRYLNRFNNTWDEAVVVEAVGPLLPQAIELAGGGRIIQFGHDETVNRAITVAELLVEQVASGKQKSAPCHL